MQACPVIHTERGEMASAIIFLCCNFYSRKVILHQFLDLFILMSGKIIILVVKASGKQAFKFWMNMVIISHEYF